MKRSLTILLSLTAFMLMAQSNPQSRKLTEKYFPELDMTINTPAFQKKKGFTKYDEMMSFINQKVTTHPELVSFVFIGESQKGAKIPMITLTNPSSKGKKMKVWMQGGLHGDEPASTEGLLFLIDRLLEDESLRPMLDHIILTIVPMANIDGYEKQHREAANGLDLNRDQTKLHAPESVFLKKAFSDFQAQVALDFHEFRPYRRDFARLGDWGVTNAFDVMFLYSGNLNVPERLRLYTQSNFVNPAKAALDRDSLTHYDYFSSDEVHGELYFNRGAVNPRSSATSYALTNCVSTLIEVRGVGIGRTSFKRRVYTTYVIALSYLQTTVARADEITSLLDELNGEKTEKIVVVSKRPVVGEEVPFIDLASNNMIILPSLVRDSWLSQPRMVRSRPEAYIILAGNEAAIANMRTLGLEVEAFPVAKEITVESYQVVKYKRDAEPFEGVHQQYVEVQIEQVKKQFPAGTYIVRTNQKNGNMLPELLEPEAVSGFVKFEVIKTSLGAELPIFRMVSTEQP